MIEDLNQRRSKKIKKLWQDSQERMAQQIAEENNLLYINLRQAVIETSALELVEEDRSREANLAVFSIERKQLKIAVFDPLSPPAIKIIEELKKQGFQSIDVGDTELVEFSNLDRALSAIPPTEVTKLVSFILKSALAIKASDIHIEPQEHQALIRFRINGVLYDVGDLTTAQYQSVKQRFKLLAGLRLNLENVAQDGRFSIQDQDDYADVRASSLPGPQGEYLVFRILQGEKTGWGLEDLGLRERGFQLFSSYLSSPNGMILVTGPTGSGKTTTLYTLLKQKISPGIKIITIENPVEYRIPGVNQTQVTKKYTFANGLKSILRQDPDVIMIGEMRDSATVKTALQAALTGHLVFSTLHTNEASGTFARLAELGADPQIVPNAVKLVVAHSHCHRLGYSTQSGIFEYFPVSPRISKAVEKEADQNTIRKIAIDEGMVPLFHSGLLKAIEGLTSLEEVVRVAGDISYIEESQKQMFSRTLTRGVKISSAEEKEMEKPLPKLETLPSILQNKSKERQIAFILGKAIKSRATDIHLEPGEKVFHDSGCLFLINHSISVFLLSRVVMVRLSPFVS